MTGEVQPQDKDSGRVERTWERQNRKRGKLTERTLEGEQVKAAWLDQTGDSLPQAKPCRTASPSRT